MIKGSIADDDVMGGAVFGVVWHGVYTRNALRYGLRMKEGKARRSVAYEE